ncbi:MAG: TylF/MycF/NovP-related O-methyltransferase [Runella sp.]
MKKQILKLLEQRFGYEIIKAKTKPNPDIDIDNDPHFLKHYQVCSPYTMTSKARMFALYQSIQYIQNAKIEGAVVECGVWRGGSSMMSALSLLPDTHREMYLYDTFEGMSEPTQADVNMVGDQAFDTWQGRDKCEADLNDVQTNMKLTQYPFDKIHFVVGKVEDTIPRTLPTKIALLRLDTDWYESTYHELTYLFPLLAKGGVLIIDDYGHWEGARKAVDQYLQENKIQILLNRIDYTGRIAIKS